MKTRRDFIRRSLTTGGILAMSHARTSQPAAADPDPAPPLPNTPLNIGAIIYPRLDQIDFTGPFEVLSQLPNSAFHILGKEKAPIRDIHGLTLIPEKTLAESPPLDVLLIPGGPGQQDLMEDEAVLAFIRDQAVRAHCVFSVCTGSLLCGAAGLLKGVRATTHWGAFDLLKYFGAIPVNERVVVDSKHVTAAGVTAGIDGALRVAAILRGDRVAQEIQLAIEYAPEPPFDSGTPETAPPEVLEAVRGRIRGLTDRRRDTARRIAAKLGVSTED
jgi:cyclohexyl-isocyanide hydratase